MAVRCPWQPALPSSLLASRTSPRGRPESKISFFLALILFVSFLAPSPLRFGSPVRRKAAVRLELLGSVECPLALKCAAVPAAESGGACVIARNKERERTREMSCAAAGAARNPLDRVYFTASEFARVLCLLSLLFLVPEKFCH